MPNFLQTREWLEFWKKASNKSHTSFEDDFQEDFEQNESGGAKPKISPEKASNKNLHDYWQVDICSHQSEKETVLKGARVYRKTEIQKLIWVLKAGIYIGFFLFLLLNLTALVFDFFSTKSFWEFLGYGGNIESMPQVCHVVDFGKSTCRFSGGFSTPNHLAAYLLLVLPIFLSDFLGQARGFLLGR